MKALIKAAIGVAIAAAISVSAVEPAVCSAYLTVPGLGMLRLESSVFNTGVEINNVIEGYNNNGDRVGALLYRVDPRKPGEISLDSIEVSENYRGMGVFTQLFSEMLRRHPDTEVLVSTLMKDNMATAMAGEDMTDTSTEHCIVMARKTPAYKVRAANGFSAVTECHVYIWGIVMSVMRP